MQDMNYVRYKVGKVVKCRYVDMSARPKVDNLNINDCL